MILFDVDVPVDVYHGNDPDGAGVDEAGHGGVGAVMREEIFREEERHLDRHDLPRVMGAHDENLGLPLVHARVVRYLDRPDGAPEKARSDGVDARERRVGERERIEERVHFRVGMVFPEVLVERGRGREIDPLENGDERAFRADPGELLVRDGEIHASVRIDVQDFDAPLDERSLRDLLRESRADDRRRGPGLRAGLAGRACGEQNRREDDENNLSQGSLSCMLSGASGHGTGGHITCKVYACGGRENKPALARG